MYQLDQVFFSRAIFGSYSYDPVKQVFVPPPQDNSTIDDDKPSQVVNGSFILSTAVGDPTTTPNPDEGGDSTEQANNNLVYRKHVTPVTHKNTAWWMRPKLPFNNLTSNIHKLNNKL